MCVVPFIARSFVIILMLRNGSIGHGVVVDRQVLIILHAISACANAFVPLQLSEESFMDINNLLEETRLSCCRPVEF